MKEALSVIGAIILAIILMIGLSFLSLGMYSFFAPKYEAVRREVFFNTPSYQLGKQQEINKIQREANNNPENAKILENVKQIQKPYIPN